MKRILLPVVTAASILALYTACSDNTTVAPKPVPGATVPTFGQTVAANGSAHACMGDDGLTAPTGYVSANLLNGNATFPSFGCTANDIDIASTTVTEYSLTGEPGSFVPLASGARIECVPNQTIFVHTFAQLQNNAQSRYDIGVWIADPINASAMSVGDGADHNCRHYNLVLGQPGVSSLEVANQQDYCGDMAQGTGLATLDLEVLQVTCPSNATTVSVNSCIGWQNSDDFNDRGFCPASFPGPGTAQEYRWGTLPETGSKCNCTPFALPIDVKASLTLVKVVTNDNGGTATVSDFPLTATGPRTISGVSGSTDVTARPVDAGSYALSEQTVANYTASSWSCAGNGTQSGSNITLAAGGVATCTITNNDNPAHLTLVKTVTNDNGGTATTANFPLTAAGPVTISGTSGSGSVTGAAVSAGTYNLSETTLAGYTAGSWSCTSGGSGSQVTLSLGGSATCTINNNDNPPTLTLVKVVTNDNGGAATTANFPLTAAGPVTISGTSGSGSVTGATVSAGTYNLSETTVAGYTAGAWSCTSGGSGSQVTLGLGGSSTCTIGNNDNPAHLTLVKVVTNDNGGTATTASFPLTAAGPVTISGTSGSGSVTGATVSAGTYNLSETTVAGYTAGSWSCTSGGSGSQVTLGLGGSSTCTIGNNDNPAHLTLVKTVTNDDGGVLTTASFPLTAAGPVTISGTSGSGSVTDAVVNAGTYNLSETTQAGYTASGWSCTSGGSGSQVTLALGGSSTCTINNNDVGAHLTLVKVVTNDNGGTATTASFPLTAAGPATITGTSGSGSVTNAPVSAGTYNLSETTVAGYTAGSWSCTSGGSGSQVTLGLGGSSTCTIGNNDNPAHLTLVKTVTNDDGGTATTANFPLTAAGPLTISGTSGSGSVTNATVSAGTYNLSETTLAGYAASSWSCTSGGSGSQVTLALGGSSTCTINNNDVGAHLTLVKVVTNDNGGTATTASFPLTGAGPVTISGTSGSGSVTGAPVPAGTYNLSETTVVGYTAGSWSCTSGGSGSQVTLGLGGSSTCTIGNNDNPAHLTLVKVVTNDNGGTATTASFPLRAAGPVTISGTSGSGSVTGATVSAGTYNLSETTLTGYTAGSWSCTSGGSGSQVTLALGGSSTCTIGNNDNPASLTIVKVVIGAGSTFGFTATGTNITTPFSLSPADNNSAQVTYSNLSAGTYTVTEDTKDGYVLTDLGCSPAGNGQPYDPTLTRTVSITLALGQSATCTFTNQQHVSQTTRTQGFWATHESLTNAVWFGGTVGGNTFGGVSDQTLCGRTLSTTAIVLGGFWSNIAKTTTNVKRTSLDQARMQLLQQLLAAILNNAAFGSSPTLMSIADAKAAYCGTNETTIQNALQAMASFNTSGDNGTFTPGVSANGKQAKTDANLTFWDILP